MVHSQELEWVRSLGGSGQEQATAISLDGRGEAYLAMASSFGTIRVGSDTVDSGNGISVVVTKFRTNGETAWAGYLATVLERDSAGRWAPNAGIVNGGAKLVTDNDGFAYLAGSFSGSVQWIGPKGAQPKGRLQARGQRSPESLPPDIFLLKLSPDGDLIWARTYGSSGQEQFLGLAICDHTLALTGNALRAGKVGPFPATDDESYGRPWVAACDLDGTVRWVRKVPATDSNYGGHVGVARDGAIAVATISREGGQVGTNTISPPVSSLLVRLDGRGQILGATPSTGSMEALAVDPLGSAYLTGSLGSGVAPFSGRVGELDIQGGYHRYIAKVGADGATLWGAANGVSGLAVGPDGIYGAGMVGIERRFGGTLLSSGFYPDAFTGRWSFDGFPAWGQAYADNADEDGAVVAVDNSGDVWIAGSVFPRGAPSALGLTYYGQTDVFVAKFKRTNPIELPPPNLGFAETEIAVKTNGIAPLRLISDVPLRSNLVIGLTLTGANGVESDVEFQMPAGVGRAEVGLEAADSLGGGSVRVRTLSGDAGARFAAPAVAHLHWPGEVRFTSNSFALDASGIGTVTLQRAQASGAPVRGSIVDLTRGEEVGRFWFPPDETDALAEVLGVVQTTVLGLKSDEAFIGSEIRARAILPSQSVQWCCWESFATRSGQVQLHIEADAPVRAAVEISGEYRFGSVVEPFKATIPKGSTMPEAWPVVAHSILGEVGGEAILTEVHSEAPVALGERRSMLIRPPPTVSFVTATVQAERGAYFSTGILLSAPLPEPASFIIRKWVKGVPDTSQASVSTIWKNSTRIDLTFLAEEGVSYVLEEIPSGALSPRVGSQSRLEIVVLPPTISIPQLNAAVPGEILHVGLNLRGAPASPATVGFRTDGGSGIAGRDFPMTNGLIRLSASAELLLPIPATARPGRTFHLLLTATGEAVLAQTNLLCTVPDPVGFGTDHYSKQADGSALVDFHLAEALDIPFAFQVVVAANETFAKMFDVTIPAGRTSVVSRLPLAQINGEIRLSLQLSANPLVELAEPMNARVLPAGANAQTQIIAASSRTEDERIVFDLPRYGPFSGPLQVRYATRDGTAIAGRDYEAASGVVTLGEATSGWAAIASVVVRRLGASPPEDREFYLDLDVPPNVVVSGSLVGRLAGQVPWTGFKIDGPNEVGEEAEFVEVKIVDENKDATFDVLTSDGTARAGVDYTAVHTTLRADGTLRVALVPNDARVEPVKIFKVTAVRASDRLTNSIDIVIVDDERGGARDETFLPIRYEGENYEVNTFGGVTGDDRIILCEASRAIWEYDRTGHFTARRPLPALPGTFKTGLVLPDGRLLVGTAGDALGQPSVFRLLPDGEFDPSFAGAVDQSTVLGLADGGAGRTVLLKRPFLENRWEIVRLLEDGAPDPAFPPIQSEPNNYEEGVARFGIQPDGAILAALSTCDWRWGCSYNRLVRIQDGTAVTLDQVVSSGFFAPPDIRARWFPHALPGGGTFLENIYPYGDVAFGYCVKPDGTLDENFTPGGTDAYLFQYLGVQSDGGIVGWSQPGVEVIRLHPGQTPRRGIILQAPGPAFYTEGTSGQMTLSRAGESSQPLEFRLKIKAGTAGPEDFANLSQVLRFAPLQNTVVLKITPLADGNVEGDEWADVGVEPLSEDVAIFGDDIRVQVSDSDPFVKLELTWEPALIGYSNQQDIFILDASDDGGRTWKPVEAVRGSFRREIDTGQPHRIYRARRNQ